MTIINRLSKVFQPRVVSPLKLDVVTETTTSKSQQLLHNLGVVRNTNVGTSFLLPLGVRSLQKLKRIVRKEMASVGANEISLPHLSAVKLWQMTNRSNLTELYKLTDRYNTEYILSPTAEETITNFVATEPLSHATGYPLRLYQITNKFRDEKKARFGLIRSKEFFMKDLYCFDTSREASETGYKEILECYNRLFKKLGVNYVQVEGNVGSIGGLLSHEFHFPAEIGDDRLIFCSSCGHAVNSQLAKKNNTCKQCSSSILTEKAGIEVGHTFLLGTKYSEPLGAKFINSDNKTEPLHMSCFGLGLSRILAASLEVLSTNVLARWPTCIAPFKFVIIPPKSGSKEEAGAQETLHMLYKVLDEKWPDDVLLDDRDKLTIGKRLHEAEQFGYPYIIVIGRDAVKAKPKIELYDIYKNIQARFDISSLLDYLQRHNESEVKTEGVESECSG